MQTVELEQVQMALPELLRMIAGGEEFTITQNGEPKAKLSAVPVRARAQAKAGSLDGKIWMAPDFDAPSDNPKE